MGPDDLPPWDTEEDDLRPSGVTELSRFDELRRESVGLWEFNLIELNGKPINENKDAAWEIIEDAFCIVLEHDPKWHYFFEDSYNIIRCSLEFADALRDYLDECGIGYSESLWVDGQPTTRKYQHIFCPMFHVFSMMAIASHGCDYGELYTLFDRVAHCFLNHQYLSAHDIFDRFGSNWEATLVANYAVGRAFYVANHATNMLHKEIKIKEEGEKWWLENFLAGIRKKLKRKNPA